MVLRSLPAAVERAERGGVDVELRVQFEQRFVDAAQFFGAEIFVIDHSPHAAIDGKCERMDRFEEVAIGKLAAGDLGSRLA